ncbi:MAG: hypothetical protein FWH55_07485 [Oscillospiraceae bacterium]|nr:hypothetical protein [Oscillospiraceae bacterium]
MEIEHEEHIKRNHSATVVRAPEFFVDDEQIKKYNHTIKYNAIGGIDDT